MKIIKDKKLFAIPVLVGIFNFVWLYINIYFTFNENIHISQDNVTLNNIAMKFTDDYCAVLLLPTILIIINRNHLSDFRLCLKSQKETICLLIIMIILFFLHKDFTITGFYQFFFYLVVIGFGEEFLYRGYIYNRLKVNSKVVAIILSGILWGTAHAILPSVSSHASISRLLLSMCNYIGSGIISGWYFIYLQEKSKTLLVPILVHAILDYTIGFVGIFTAIGTFVYFLLKHHLRCYY